MKTEAIADAILSFLGRKKPPPQLVKPFTIKCRGLACDSAEIEGEVYWFDKTPLCATCYPTVERKASLRVRAMIPLAVAGLLVAGEVLAQPVTTVLPGGAIALTDNGQTMRVVPFTNTRARVFDTRCQLDRPAALCPAGTPRSLNGYVDYLDTQDVHTSERYAAYFAKTHPYATKDWWDDLRYADFRWAVQQMSMQCWLAIAEVAGTGTALITCPSLATVPGGVILMPACLTGAGAAYFASAVKMKAACLR